jgi:hypothetical protein
MATPNQTDPAPEHMLRVPHDVFLGMRIFDRQLEQLTGRKITRAESLRVALQCARNATDDELSDYLRETRCIT